MRSQDSERVAQSAAGECAPPVGAAPTLPRRTARKETDTEPPATHLRRQRAQHVCNRLAHGVNNFRWGARGEGLQQPRLHVRHILRVEAAAREHRLWRTQRGGAVCTPEAGIAGAAPRFRWRARRRRRRRCGTRCACDAHKTRSARRGAARSSGGAGGGSPPCERSTARRSSAAATAAAQVAAARARAARLCASARAPRWAAHDKCTASSAARPCSRRTRYQQG